MIHFLPLVPLMIWLGFAEPGGDAPTPPPPFSPAAATILLLLALASIVLLTALRGRRLLRRAMAGGASLGGFWRSLVIARVACLIVFTLFVYWLGFGNAVRAVTPRTAQLPGLILATLPVLAAWLGLVWAGYPIDRALREDALFDALAAGSPVHAPPSLADALVNALRGQILFLVTPVLATIALRDAATLALGAARVEVTAGVESIVFFASVAIVYLFSPVLMTRVLGARPMPASPLRERLDSLARAMGLKYRDLLIWHTRHAVSNAAVMGIVPRFRYMLLSDLLIETLDDEQIEAVFAHEAGHVTHRHLLWYVVFFAIFSLAMIGPGDWAYGALRGLGVDRFVPSDWLVFAGFSATFVVLFGMLSRLFERQADWYAARSMAIGSTDGAESFVGALTRVAQVNRLPLGDRAGRGLIRRSADTLVHFLHPSVPARVAHVRGLADAERARRFDRQTVAVRATLLVTLAVLTAWVVLGYAR